jgi:hypothetical protein
MPWVSRPTFGPAGRTRSGNGGVTAVPVLVTTRKHGVTTGVTTSGFTRSKGPLCGETGLRRSPFRPGSWRAVYGAAADAVPSNKRSGRHRLQRERRSERCVKGSHGGRGRDPPSRRPRYNGECIYVSHETKVQRPLLHQTRGRSAWAPSALPPVECDALDSASGPDLTRILAPTQGQVRRNREVAWVPEAVPLALMGCIPVWPPDGTVPVQVNVPSPAAVAAHMGSASEALEVVP